MTPYLDTAPLNPASNVSQDAPKADPRPRQRLRARLSSAEFSASVILFGVLFVITLWAGLLTFLHHEKDTFINARIRENLNIATGMQESTVRVMASIDQVTQRAAVAMQNGSLNPSRIVQYANETGLTPTILVQLSVVDANGIFIGSNIDPDSSKTGPLDLSTREHVQIHLHPELVPKNARALMYGSLFIGKPVLGKVSKRWTIQISKKVTDAQGKPIGVIVASLDPAYFESVYSQAQLGQGGLVALFGSDLTIRARVVSGQPTSEMGAQIKSDSPLARNPLERQGSYVSPSSVDGIDRVVAYQQVGGFPLYVAVGTPTELALEDWRTLATLADSLAILLTLTVAVAVIVFARKAKELEERNAELVDSERRALSASRAKSDFLAAVSHELRTPLTGIRGFAELMERRLTDDRFREQASIIRKSAEHLNALLTDILDFAKIEAGAMSTRLSVVSLRRVLSVTIDLFRVTALQKGIELQLVIDPLLHDRVETDELKLKQILNNLLSNALKFTEQGSVSIHASTTAGWLTLAIRDTGPGIPAELHEVIFERFRQASSQVTNDHGGTGLGLALSRGLAELLGGTLSVQSEPGQGATFTLRLPLRAVESETVEPASQAEQSVPAGSSE